MWSLRILYSGRTRISLLSVSSEIYAKHKKKQKGDNIYSIGKTQNISRCVPELMETVEMRQ